MKTKILKPKTDAAYEIRTIAVPVEIRAEDDDAATVTVEGYAAVFNEETTIGDYFREQFMPGAFKEAIREDDIVFLINHDDLPLARSKAGEGTLTLKEDKKGLKIRADLDANDPDVARIVPKMKRGDLTKMSIAFWPVEEEWRDKEDELPLRSVTKSRLFDVSIVTRPAYEGTDIGLRALQRYREESKSAVSSEVRRVRMKIQQGLRARSIGNKGNPNA